jgi:hypothetical protein
MFANAMTGWLTPIFIGTPPSRTQPGCGRFFRHAKGKSGTWRPEMNQTEIVFTSRILRKKADLPRYIVVKPEHVAGYDRSFAALVSLNGSPPFTRNVRPWGKGSDVFFFNLTELQCKKAGLDTNNECVISIKPL